MADDGITDRPSRPDRDNGQHEDENERPATKRRRRRDDEGGLTRKDRQWAMFCHLSSLVATVPGLLLIMALNTTVGDVGLALLAGVVTGLCILGPLICWLIKKDESEFVDDHGKESVNFQISMLLWTINAVAITVATCGYLGWVLFVLALMRLICPILAGMKATDGDFYKYPGSYPFLK